MSGLHEICATVEGGGRIDTAEAATLWRHASDEELQRLAGLVRARYHDPDRATYMVMRIINYTNVCVAQCDYCAFYVLPNRSGGYVLSREDVFAKIDELLELGGDLVGFNGGFNPKLPLDYYCDLFASVRERYGERVEFYALTVAEFVFLADRAGLSYAEAAARLRDAGVQRPRRASGWPGLRDRRTLRSSGRRTRRGRRSARAPTRTSRSSSRAAGAG